MSIASSVKFDFDANGVLPAHHQLFESLVSHGFRKGVIVWEVSSPPAEMIDAAWETILAADWDNLTPADVEDALIAALKVRLP